MTVICPKCQYQTERSLLSDHLAKCRLKPPEEKPAEPALSSPTKHRLKSGENDFAYEQNSRGRERSRDRLKPQRWKKSRDRLDQRSRSRDQLNSDRGGRSRSRDNLDREQGSSRRQAQARSRSRSVENLAGPDPVIDIAAAIERDIERINIYQGRENSINNADKVFKSESRRTNTDDRASGSRRPAPPPPAAAAASHVNTYTAPAQRSLVDRSTRNSRFGSVDNLAQVDSRSTPNLNDAFTLETSDDSLGSNNRGYSNMVIQGSFC